MLPENRREGRTGLTRYETCLEALKAGSAQGDGDVGKSRQPPPEGTVLPDFFLKRKRTLIFSLKEELGEKTIK